MPEDRAASYQELKERVAQYINREIPVEIVAGTALPCCGLAQPYPGRKDNYTGEMTCVNCGTIWILTRKAGVLRVQSK